jgi:lipoprotein-releasing system permease protein
MNLTLQIALTHVRHRARQTLVAIAGVATGVGFSVMMEAMMEGSQDDFIRRLVDALAHVSVTDELRQPLPQPADRIFDAAEIHGLTPEVRRPGIKNPLATIKALESWVPGAVTPSVQSKAIIRYAGRNVSASIVGIDPPSEVKVSTLANHMKAGTINSLYRSSNAIILGDRLATKLGARINSNLTLASAKGINLTATVVGLSHSGLLVTDENTAYVLLKTAQVLEAQTGLINEIRVRANDPMAARLIAERIGAETGYKSMSWQEAQEDLLSTIELRNVLMYTIVGAILLVASFGTYNIISTITHEKTRDIAIMKSLGFRQASVRQIFILEALIIGSLGTLIGWGLGYLLCRGLGSLEFKTPFTDADRLPIAYTWIHYAIAAAVAVGSSVIAGYFPARRAAGLHPVEIIRGAT